MARTGKPWAVMTAATVSVLVTAGALVAAAVLRDRPQDSSNSSAAPATTPSAGIDGCLVEPCTVVGQTNVGGIAVDLVADRDAHSGRLRVGGAGASEVFEVEITKNGATLTRDSLQCVAGPLSACVVRGPFPQGVLGEVVVGRTGEWSELTQLFQSDAGYLALSEITPGADAVLLVAQHRCDRTVEADCSTTPVFVRVYNLRAEEQGCTRDYPRLDALPGWPAVVVPKAALKPCT
jgi:hypothetical protein